MTRPDTTDEWVNVAIIATFGFIAGAVVTNAVWLGVIP